MIFKTVLRVFTLVVCLFVLSRGQVIPVRQNVPTIGRFGRGERFVPVRQNNRRQTPFLTGSIVHGTCYFNDTYSPVKGRVDLRQDLAVAPPLIQVRVQVMGLPASTMSDQEHAMHVHQWGNIGRNCYNAGPHFDVDPFSRHGGPNSMDRTRRHDGDFGNLRQTNDGVIDTTFNVQNLMLAGDNGVLGRTIVLHESRDDLGLGTNPVSFRTGNAGPPIACCVIALADTTNWDKPLFVNGQFPNPGLNPMNPVIG